MYTIAISRFDRSGFSPDYPLRIARSQKTCIIFDSQRHRYQKFLSDIAGQDIRAHHGNPAELIRAVRNALATTQPPGVLLHSAASIVERYGWFQQDLPESAGCLGWTRMIWGTAT